METHFPGSVITERKEWPNEVDTQPSDSGWQMAKQIVSVDRIRWAIQSFSPFKSSGIDGIYIPPYYNGDWMNYCRTWLEYLGRA